MDRGALAIVDRIFSTNLSIYPGFGVIILLLSAFVIGLIGRVKLYGGTLSLGAAINLAARGKLKRVLNSPLIEAELFPNTAFFRGWLVDIVRERVTMKDGSKKYEVFYYCFFPSASIPSSGWALTVKPEAIKWILDRPSSRLLRNIFSFGTSGNDWQRIEFDVDNFPPHNPEPD